MTPETPHAYRNAKNQNVLSVLETACVRHFPITDLLRLAGVIDVLHISRNHLALLSGRLSQRNHLRHMQRHAVLIRHRFRCGRRVIGLGQPGKSGAGEGGGKQKRTNVHEILPCDAKRVRCNTNRTCRTGRQPRAEGVRFSTVFDHGVKRWLTRLNAGCQGVRRFSSRGLANSYRSCCFVCFRGLEREGYCRVSLQNQRLGFGHLRRVHCICAIICTANFYVREVHCCGGCVQDAFGRAEFELFSVDQACTRPPPTVWSRFWRLPTKQLSNQNAKIESASKPLPPLKQQRH